MRLNGEIEIPCYDDEVEDEAKDRDEDKEEELGSIVSAEFSQPPTKLVVGYALTSKKKKSFLQPKLIGLARNKGISFIAIDPNRTLSEQGPFDVVLHKLPGKEWCEVIEDYRKKNPDVTVLDPPNAVHHLHNRQSMLQDVADLNLSDFHGKVRVPKQLIVTKDPSSIPNEVAKAGLKLPLDLVILWVYMADACIGAMVYISILMGQSQVSSSNLLRGFVANYCNLVIPNLVLFNAVVKPLLVDGSPKSHELFLAYDQCSLSELEPPVVLQEFVNHGGVLFKIYIVGDAIKVVRRFSLPNISKRELEKLAGVFRFPRVSCAAASADDADLDPSIAELPQRPLLERLARELRQRLGLRLFNVDMIREYGTKDVFYVIDINYFPGFGKMPEYEHIFTDFLLSFVQSKYKKRPAT